MKDMGLVQGSQAQAAELVVSIDTVYVHTNITKLETDAAGNAVEDQYQYNEVQYTKDEYIALLSNRNKELGELVNTILGVTENE